MSRLRREDLPDRLNLADWFVDRRVEDGHGHRPALVTDDGVTTYA